MTDIVNLRPAGFTLDQLDEELQAMALVRALPGDYKHLSSNLLMHDKLNKDIVLEAFLATQLNDNHEEQSLNRAQAYYSNDKGKMPYRGG